jgi:hypothetical protein
MIAIPPPAHGRGGADAVSGGRDQGRVIRPPSSGIIALLGCGRRHASWLVLSPRVCQNRGVAPGERAEFWRNTLVKRYEPLGPAMRCTRSTTTPWPKYVAGQLRQRYRAGIRVGKSVTASGIWRANDVTVLGETASWKDSTVARHFCPSCGYPRCSAHSTVRSQSGSARSTSPQRTSCQPTSCGWRVGRSGFGWRLPRSSFRGIGRRWCSGQALLRGTTAEVSRSSIRILPRKAFACAAVDRALIVTAWRSAPPAAARDCVTTYVDTQ